MPELPEVETMRRGIAGVVGGQIRNIERVACRLRPIVIQPSLAVFRRRVVGRSIVETDRAGKRLLLRLEGDSVIVFEPRMTGLVLVADPPNEEHLRVRLDLVGCPVTSLWYWDRRGLGSVRFLVRGQWEHEFGPDRLGPDALKVTCDDLRARLVGSRRAVKVALLDQRIVAGIGNLYASEILHLAGVHPEQRCDRITRTAWSRIHAALIEILEDAIRHEGSTLSDGTYRNALNQSGGYQNLHRVYDRAGEPCGRCRRGVIRRIVQAQRATFYCPGCQKR